MGRPGGVVTPSVFVPESILTSRCDRRTECRLGWAPVPWPRGLLKGRWDRTFVAFARRSEPAETLEALVSEACPGRGVGQVQDGVPGMAGDGGEPDLVLCEVVQWERAQAGILGGADAVLAPGWHTKTV